MTTIRLCGMLHSEPAVAAIAGVDLCAHHLAIVADIQAGRGMAKWERAASAKARTEEAKCPCGRVFRYVHGQGGARVWCDECLKIPYYNRRKRLKEQVS